jgi:transketolase
VLLGDGETHEGSVWEATAAASHHRLGNLVAIVDSNGLSVDGRLGDVLTMEPMAAKWEAFGWDAVTVDGHDLDALRAVLAPPRMARRDRPKVVIANTVKGKGVSFMEDVRSWHADTISPEQYRRVLAELGA